VGLVDVLRGRRVVDVAVLGLDDERQDVRAPEHLAKLVVDLDVGVSLAERDFLAQDRELQRTGIEVEELREHFDVGALVGEEDRHHGGDDRHSRPGAGGGGGVGGGPKRWSHEARVAGAAGGPSCFTFEPSTRKTRPSEPTASPWPPGASQTERIQLAASWSGSGSTVQEAPPLAVLSTVP